MYLSPNALASFVIFSVQEAASGAEEGPVALLPPAAAGCKVEGLTFLCVDGSGRPTAEGVQGKVQASWSRGSKKVKLLQTAMKLPDLQVCKLAALHALYYYFAEDDATVAFACSDCSPFAAAKQKPWHLPF